MDSDLLASFVVFAEHLNFTAAARELHISQPALHVQVRKLSEQVGLPLYRRRGRTLVLTADGERVASFARDQADRATRFLADLRGDTAEGPVVLAAGHGAYQYLLGPVLRSVARARSTRLQMLVLNGPDAIESVTSARSHVAVAAIDTPTQLESLPFRDVGQIAVVPRDHRLAKRRRLTISDLDGEPLIVPPQNQPHRTMLGLAFASSRANLQIGVEATGWALMLELVRSRAGVAIVNDFCPPPPGTKAIPIKGLPVVRYRIYHRRDPSPRVAELVDRLAA